MCAGLYVFADDEGTWVVFEEHTNAYLRVLAHLVSRVKE